MPVKNEEEAYERTIDNNDYTAGNLLDFAYYKKHYKLIAIDLSKQTKLKDPQQLILLENVQEILEQQCFLSQKDQKKQLLVFSQNSVTIV